MSSDIAEENKQLIEKFDVASAIQTSQRMRYNSYCTVIYSPAEAIIDFGPAKWPCEFNKSVSCPRVLLVNTWTDGQFGLVGGMHTYTFIM